MFRRDDGTVTPGYRNFRGSVESTGQFALNQKWVWGWDAVSSPTRPFSPTTTFDPRDADRPFQTGLTEGTSQLYLTGKGDRSHFDIRAQHFYGSRNSITRGAADFHPVMDYKYIFGQPVLGGELGYKLNLTSLSRRDASFDPITRSRKPTTLCNPLSADPAVENTSNCLLRGVSGTCSRFSAEANWKRSITDSFGQLPMSFAYVRADVASMDIRPDPGVSNYLDIGES